MKVLTIDVEEWFHILDFEDTKSECQWKNYEVRIYENMDRVFRVLEETDTKATFFIIGWIAQNYPDIVKRIAEKYQIGSHTMNHQLVWQQTPKEFKIDVEKSVKLLEDVSGKKVTCFRAPGFSIRKSEEWAFEIMAELGITTDCSVFPAVHAHGGMPYFNAQKPSIIECKGMKINEFPVTPKYIAGKAVVFSGGGYFRLCPYPLIKKWTDEQDYTLAYIHPRDLDAEQPMLQSLPLNRKFKSYVGLKSAEDKLKKYLTDFEFCDLTVVDEIL